MIKLPKWLTRKKSNASNPPPPPSVPGAGLRQQSSQSGAINRMNGNGSGLIANPSSQPQPEPLPFQHPLYSMDNDGMIRFKATGKQLDENDIAIHQEEILNAVVGYVQDTMKREMGFQEVYLPSNSPQHLKCNVFVSSNYLTAKKLVLFVAVSRGLSPGIWSRGLILNSGVRAGSMLAYFRKALDEGYGIIVPNPNKNAVMMRDSNKKVPIPGSSSPEEHMDSVWDAFVSPADAKRIFFIGYSYGGVLVKYLLHSRGEALLRRNGAVALIESSHRIEDGDSNTVKSLLAHRAMYWEVNHDIPLQGKLDGDSPYRTGCTCLSAGKPPRALSNHYYVAAFCIKNVMDPLFRFLNVRDATAYLDTEKNRPADVPPPPAPLALEDNAMDTSTNTFRPDMKRTQSGRFNNPGSEKHCNLCLFHFTFLDRRHHCRMCHRAVCNACSKDRLFLPGASTAQRVCTDCASDGNKPFPPPETLMRQQSGGSTVGSSSSGSGRMRPNSSSSADQQVIDPREDRNRSTSFGERQAKSKLGVEDFDLLKVIGQGAFGKVMLVRRKDEVSEESAGATYAMKVLKKANVFAKNQVEHTKSERRILRDIDHPFVVRLRYAFQTDDKLYLVMDYYTGGTLFFHLRKSRKFSETRARFYAAQLLMAMSHLHDLNIAYRDLKLENILMDDKGYVALTDFGLSKENVDVPDGAKTFCGTAEYIAPELLKGLSYGKPVDWWGFGTLLFEMMTGQTPFFDKNRKKMFHNILHRDVIFTPVFSEDAKDLLTRLLLKDPAKRLGSGPSGAQEIMDHAFFASIDWDKLFRKEIDAPFKPVVSGELDTNNVAPIFLRAPVRDSPVTQQLGATAVAAQHFEGDCIVMDPSEWHALGEVQYQKHRLYEMDPSWKEEVSALGDLKEFLVVPAPFGGPIAMIRDPSRLVKMDSRGSLSRNLFIFNACGAKLASISFSTYDSKKKTLFGMFWTDEMRLLCVFDDGDCVSYSIMGAVENNFSLFPSDSKFKVISFESWGGGLVALLDNFMIAQALDIDSVKPRVYCISDTGVSPSNPPTCMAVLDPRFVKSGLPEIFLGTSTNSLIVVSKGTSSSEPNRVLDVQLQTSLYAPISKIAIAPNGRFVAIFTQDGKLAVFNAAFDKQILSFTTPSKTSPAVMLWCGEDSVLLYWQSDGLVMVGPKSSWLKFPCDEGPIVLSQEVDSCRIYSSRSHQLLMRVPRATENIKRIGSTAPAAMLLDALDAFDSGDAKADENIRSIQVQRTLEQAITDCITAAGNEFDYSAQTTFLRAAAYGKNFYDNSNPGGVADNPSSNYDSEFFAEMSRKLRLLTAIRKPSIGLPLTLAQYDHLSIEVVVSRLVAMRHHFLALKICDYMKISSDRVLVHWACEKVKSSFEVDPSGVPFTDEAIVSMVRKKLKDATLVSYSEIASCAERAGRHRLATMLLDLEENSSDQVPLLLSMGEFELALRKSLESSNTDLIYLTLFHMERTMPPDDVRRVLHSEPQYAEAINLLAAFYIATKVDSPKLENIWHEVSSANHDVLTSFTEPSTDDKLKKLKDAMVKYNSAKLPINAKLTEEQMELLTEQRKLDERASAGPYLYVGMSLSDTIRHLCMDAKREPKSLQVAAAISKKFKVPEKRFYRVKIKALAETQQWDILHKFSNEKKSPPCGFKAFAIACLQQGEKGQAESYASRITQPDEKFDTLIHLQMWNAALEMAIKLKDPDKLSSVRNNCPLSDIHVQIDQAAQQLGFI